MTETNPARVARLTGISYLGIIVTGIFAEFFVRMSVLDPQSARATAAQIADSIGMFRAGLVADVAMIGLDVAVAIGLYVLLRDVHRPLAALAAALRLIQAAVLGANLMNMTAALQWAQRSADSAVHDVASTDAMALAALELHRVVYDLGLVFFGLACLVLGHLLRTSRIVPAVFGAGLSVAGVVYLIGSLTVVLAPELAPTLDPLYGLTLLAELGVAGWLTTKGVKAPQPLPSPAPAAA